MRIGGQMSEKWQQDDAMMYNVDDILIVNHIMKEETRTFIRMGSRSRLMGTWRMKIPPTR
jgi:hypothetical protein